MTDPKTSLHDLNSAISRLDLLLGMVLRNSLPDGDSRDAILKSGVDALATIKKHYKDEKEKRLKEPLK